MNYEDAQLAHRGLFWQLEHRLIGPVTSIGVPYQLSKTPAIPRLTAPCLGEHTEWICRDIIGMPDQELRELLADGTLEKS